MSRESGLGFAEIADPYRAELLAHCYRMTGSVHDAEDLVQETLLRAWRGYDRFDGRSSLRTWLYRIATNACLTALQSSQRRALPSGLGAADQAGTLDLERADAVPWISPIRTAASDRADPAHIATVRESTRLALIAALQHLPARQRAVLLLVEVVGFGVPEAARFLDVSYPATRSLLQRARATLKQVAPRHDDAVPPLEGEAEILARYLAAFEAADTAALARLLRDDTTYEMPPMRRWFRGPAAIVEHHEVRVWSRPRSAIATWANGHPAVATYVDAGSGRLAFHGVHVLEIAEGLIDRIVVFLDPTLAEAFEVPHELAAP
ncbi:RNA polymerase, sigma subunit, ECF family [Nocardioides terrae]|uniref:RNA polymerase sigma factor n=1 Tax=Nocardioides terrae TaxID=574651 RepID=A0A1I1KX59_9ACTN|nr:RNA polymerase subunit sigma-70 [Nocardioides terrae]SFC65384.1 RNA polymerase, sigma subunit, ECF family [Nocardioides terrae]